MATTRIADVIDPEVLSDLVITKIEDNLFLLPGLAPDPNFKIPTPGTAWKIPYANKLGDLEDFVPGTPLNIQNMAQSYFRGIVVRKAGLYGIDSEVEAAAYKNPMEYFAEQISEKILESIMETQINILAGGIPSANINNQTGVAVTEALIQATKQKLGDKAGNLKWCVMNSAIYATLEAAGKITWQPRSQVLPVLAGAYNSQVMNNAANMVPTIAGMIIVQSDKILIGASAATDYNTYLLGDKAMGLYYQRQITFDEDKDISLLEKYKVAYLDFVLPLYGVDYTSTSYLAADLATTGNYTLKWNHKLVQACRLIAKA